MFECKLTIVCKHPKQVHPGEGLPFAVLAKVSEACRCEQLTVERYWCVPSTKAVEKLDRSTSMDHGDSERFELGPQELEVGTNRVAFDTDLPPGPYSYLGEVLAIEWRFEVTARITGQGTHRSDPIRIHLVPAGDEDEFSIGSEARFLKLRKKDEPLSLGRRLLDTALIPVSMAGLAVALYVGLSGRPLQSDDWMVLAFFGGLELYGLYYLYNRVLQRPFADTWLGPVELDMDSETLSPGDTLPCRLRIVPTGSGHLEKATVALHAHEAVETVRPRSGVGVDIGRVLMVHADLHKEERELVESDGLELSAGREHVLTTSFAIPGSAPYSFLGNKVHGLFWYLSVELQPREGATWKRRILLRMRPRLREPDYRQPSKVAD